MRKDLSDGAGELGRGDLCAVRPLPLIRKSRESVVIVGPNEDGGEDHTDPNDTDENGRIDSPSIEPSSEIALHDKSPVNV